MSEQEALPIVEVPPPPPDLLHQIILQKGEIEQIHRDIQVLEVEALRAYEAKIATKNAELVQAVKIRDALLARARDERVYQQGDYILHDSSQERRSPRVDEFRIHVAPDILEKISEVKILLGKADALLGKDTVRGMCDIQRGPPILDAIKREKKHYATPEGFWRSSI